MVRRCRARNRCDVAAQAIPIVGSGIAHELLMWVVASNASQSSIPLFSPAPALFQAIRLRPDVADPCEATKFDVPPCPMASTAEIDGIHRIEFAGIKNQVRLFSGLPRLPL